MPNNVETQHMYSYSCWKLNFQLFYIVDKLFVYKCKIDYTA